MHDPFETLALRAVDFDKEIDGKAVKLYYLKNTNGIEMAITNYGQRLVSLITPDKNGKSADIVLGFPKLDDYLNNEEHYFGAVIGRYGNRIDHGKFSLGENTYHLATNSNGHHLHGGIKSFSHIVWDTKVISDRMIEFYYTSPHMEEGYPGTLKVSVQYLLTEDNALNIHYRATTDQSTIVSMTHHSYFNLAGAGTGNIEDHSLTINASHYIPVDKTLIPIGTKAPVQHTPFDFSVPKTIGHDLYKTHPQLKHAKGYDHNFVLNNSPINNDGLVLAARVTEALSGRCMEVFTDAPGMQLYTGNSLHSGIIGKNNLSYDHRSAFCLETQHFPDAPNHDCFPSTIITPEQPYVANCTYKFSTEK